MVKLLFRDSIAEATGGRDLKRAFHQQVQLVVAAQCTLQTSIDGYLVAGIDDRICLEVIAPFPAGRKTTGRP